MKDRPFIYLAAPLFNDRERAFNELLASHLENWATVFLPQRDGQLLAQLIEDGMTPTLAERRVFRADISAMMASDLLIAVLDGAHIDEGVAFEIGFVCGRNSCCVGLQTDTRRALPSGNNPMIGRSLQEIFATTENLMDWVSCWSEEWRQNQFQSVG
jgi:nucleoside 2-deoxyribosyltransferase